MTPGPALTPEDALERKAGNFRPDIEGLRGIAIFMVVLAHANAPGFQGGFAGVDVFFVISGFLITGLLLRELRHSSSVDFFSFYARRVRRLLPAFSAMAVCTMLAVIFIAPGTDEKLQASSGMWAALWSSNIFYSVAEFGYFDASARDSIFVHTWSLGVEEQFYLIWPALLLCVWRASRGALRAMAATIFLIALLGFALCIAATVAWPVEAYYLTPFRLWELAAGGVCCALSTHRLTAEATMLRHAAIPGFLLLICACVFLNDHSPYPGYRAALPVAGAALLIAAGTVRADGAIYSLLATSALRYVGRISYSWYLWHWPALLVAKRLGYGEARGLTVAIAVSFLAASASYWLIERPTQHRVITVPRQIVVIGVLGAALLALMFSVWRTTLHVSISATAEQRIRSTITVPRIYSMPGCDEWYSSDRLVPCEFSGPDGGKHTAVVLGDSLGIHLLPAFMQAFEDAGWTLVVLTKSSCPIVDESFFYERIHRIYTECDSWRRSAIAYVQQTKPDLVIVGSAGSYPFTDDQWLKGSGRAFVQLKAGARRVLVLAPTPRLPFDGPSCAISHASTIFQGDGLSDCTARLSTIEDHAVVNDLRQAIDKLSDVSLLYLNDAICPDGICAAVRSGALAYRDSEHLNASYVDTLSKTVKERLAPYIDRAEHDSPP